MIYCLILTHIHFVSLLRNELILENVVPCHAMARYDMPHTQHFVDRLRQCAPTIFRERKRKRQIEYCYNDERDVCIFIGVDADRYESTNDVIHALHAEA